MVSDSGEACAGLEDSGRHGACPMQSYCFVSLFSCVIYLCIREKTEPHLGLSWCIFSWVLNSFWAGVLGRVMWYVTCRLHVSVPGGQQGHIETSAWEDGKRRHSLRLVGFFGGKCCVDLPVIPAFLLWFLLEVSLVDCFQSKFYLSPVNINQLMSEPGIGQPHRMA